MAALVFGRVTDRLGRRRMFMWTRHAIERAIDQLPSVLVRAARLEPNASAVPGRIRTGRSRRRPLGRLTGCFFRQGPRQRAPRCPGMPRGHFRAQNRGEPLHPIEDARARPGLDPSPLDLAHHMWTTCSRFRYTASAGRRPDTTPRGIRRADRRRATRRRTIPLPPYSPSGRHVSGGSGISRRRHAAASGHIREPSQRPYDRRPACGSLEAAAAGAPPSDQRIAGCHPVPSRPSRFRPVGAGARRVHLAPTVTTSAPWQGLTTRPNLRGRRA